VVTDIACRPIALALGSLVFLEAVRLNLEYTGVGAAGWRVLVTGVGASVRKVEVWVGGTREAAAAGEVVLGLGKDGREVRVWTGPGEAVTSST